MSNGPFNYDPIPSAQDFGQTGTGYGAILQPGPTQVDDSFRFYNSMGTGNILGLDFTSGGTPATTTTPVTTVPTGGGGGGAINLPAGNFDYTLDSGFFAKNPPAMPYGPAFTPPSSNVRVMTPDELPIPGGGGGGNMFSGFSQNPAAMAGLAKGAGGIMAGLFGRRRRKSAQRAAQSEYDRMMEQYKNLDTSNLYADVENQYANLENVYEDLTVNRQQAEFERDSFRQQQANIMSSLSTAAGGSGIASLAQAMANQASIQARSSSATIGQQERENQLLRAREASRLQLIERRGEQQAEAMRLQGAETARGLEYRQTGTLLGMSQQRLAAANQAVAQGNAALMGGIGTVLGTVGGFMIGGPVGAKVGSAIGSSLGGS